MNETAKSAIIKVCRTWLSISLYKVLGKWVKFVIFTACKQLQMCLETQQNSILEKDVYNLVTKSHINIKRHQNL